MKRYKTGTDRARVAVVPLAPTAKYTVPPSPPSFRPVIVVPALGRGAIGCWTGDRDRAVDLWLDSLDAANEGPDGSLPGREAA